MNKDIDALQISKLLVDNNLADAHKKIKELQQTLKLWEFLRLGSEIRKITPQKKVKEYIEYSKQLSD